MPNRHQRSGVPGVVVYGRSRPFFDDNRMTSNNFRFFATALAVFISSVAYAADIPKPPDANRYRGDVAKMRSGSIKLKDPEAAKAEWAKNQKSIDTVAEWLAYTLATPPYNGEPVPREDKTPAFVDRSMSALMQEVEFFTTLNPPASNQGKLLVEQVEFGVEFGKALGKAVQVVLDNSARPIERINGVRMLSIAARMPCPDLADRFMAVIANPKTSDAEKIYAFQGLKNLMEQVDFVDPSKHIIRDVNQLGKIAQTLSAYIVQDRAPKDDRETAVIEYVRRHAIAALATLKDGVYRKPNRDLIFRPSWTLMRVIASDPSISPPFSVAEKVEAMVGFCQMRNDPEMNLDVAAYMIAVAPMASSSGATLGGLVEFARSANQDGLRVAKESNLPMYHWKIGAARLSLALATWREMAKPLARTRNPDAIISLASNRAIPMLSLIEKEGAAAQTGAEVQGLTTWATDNPPKAWAEMKAAQLYSDDPQSVVPFAARAAKKGTDPKLVTPAPMPMPMTPPTKGPDPKAVDPKSKTPPKKPN